MNEFDVFKGNYLYNENNKIIDYEVKRFNLLNETDEKLVPNEHIETPMEIKAMGIDFRKEDIQDQFDLKVFETNIINFHCTNPDIPLFYIDTMKNGDKLIECDLKELLTKFHYVY